MSTCLDMKALIRENDDEKLSVGNLKKLLKQARYDEMAQTQILLQYQSFRASVRTLCASSSSDSDFIRLFEFALFKNHQCNYACEENCLKKGKLESPKEPVGMKVLHLFLKEKELYQGHEMFLHFFLRCAMKTHAEGVAESMGSVMDLHSDKRRGLSIDDVGKESIIHWNGPPVHLAEALGEKALNRVFKGRPWHFVTKKGNISTVYEMNHLKRI